MTSIREQMWTAVLGRLAGNGHNRGPQEDEESEDGTIHCPECDQIGPGPACAHCAGR